jgi:hypothetical protein
MNGHDKQVLEEYRRFEAMLPRLMSTLRERWVVFYQGEVQSVHGGEREALAAGVATFGYDAAFVVAPVREPTVSTIGPTIRFGSR